MTISDPRPRIILEQASDGSIVIETYTNGQRQRSELLSGADLLWEIKDALARKQRELDTSAERRQRKLMADAHIIRPAGVPLRPGQEQAHAADAIASLIRVCHCGTEVTPFMERCADCPGAAGAGFIKREELPLTQAEIERKERARHKRVWERVAYGSATARGFGPDFANRTVGPLTKPTKKSAHDTSLISTDLL